MGQKHAIVIAVEHPTDVDWEPVTFALADARAVSAALVPLGFTSECQQVLVGPDATLTRCASRLRRVLDAADVDDQVLIFYVGPGFSVGSENHLACHDTEEDDLTGTALRMADLVGWIQAARCAQVVLLLDACHDGLASAHRVAAGRWEAMLEAPLHAAFADNEKRVCLASSKTTETSHSTPDARHGLWTSHLLGALTGRADDALGNDGSLTTKSLQRHLSTAVPMSLQRTRTVLRPQTPTAYGRASDARIIARVERADASRTANGSRSLERAAFSTEWSVRVRSLSGYRKHHRIPDAVSDWATQFVGSLSTEELEAEVDRWFTALKAGLGYTRKQVQLDVGEGAATLFTPDFSMEVSVDVDPDDPSQARFKTELVNLTNTELLESDAFDRTFARAFDVVELEHSGGESIEEIVDRVEAARNDRVTLEYPHDLSSCSLTIEGLPFVMRFTPGSLRLAFEDKASPQTLAEGLAACSDFLLSEHDLPLLGA